MILITRLISLPLLSPNSQTKKMMQQSELLLPTWQNFNFGSSILDQELDLPAMDDLDFSYTSTMIMNEFYDLDNIQTSDIEDICGWINGDEIEANSSSHDLTTMEGNEWSPSLSSESNHNSSVFPQLDASLPTLVLPEDAMEVDEQLTLVHLLRAYGEAMENGQKELAQVIMTSIIDKSSPLGNTTERLAYNLFQSRDNQGEYLREESSKNLAAAFKVLYQSLPNGRFAHFTANSAILNSIPDDSEVVHIVDFDMGEGVQWPPLMEALSRKGKGVRLTSIKESNSCCWEFDDTKKRLISHAKLYGLSIQIEENSIEDVGVEQGEWLVFNCMKGLPHMGRRQPGKSVDGFMKEAKTLIANNGGILVLGDGEALEEEDLNICNGYASYFDALVRHYQAVLESSEWNFPVYLAEARVAVECLFLAPLMSEVAWFQEWEGREKNETKTWLGGRKLSIGSLIEAKEMVAEGENSYNVKIVGMGENEMVLRWKETPLVRVSTWM